MLFHYKLASKAMLLTVLLSLLHIIHWIWNEIFTLFWKFQHTDTILIHKVLGSLVQEEENTFLLSVKLDRTLVKCFVPCCYMMGELHDSCKWLTVIRVMKSNKLQWTGHVEHIGESYNCMISWTTISFSRRTRQLNYSPGI